MRGLHALSASLAAAASLVIALGVPVVGQSPSAVASPQASTDLATSPNASAPASTVAVGPITWKQGKRGKDFGVVPAVYSAGQLPDGRLVVTGSTGKDPSKVAGAVWVSADGSKWQRAKGLKTPVGSAVTTIGSLGPTLVATGMAADRTGLTWTSQDGDTWSAAAPLAGAIFDQVPTPAGLVGVGIDGPAAAAWTTSDGVTWQEITLAPSGRALHILQAPDGSLVATGAVTDDADVATPVLWRSVDGATWTETVLAGLQPGRWSNPAAAASPAGLVVSFSESGESGTVGHVWTSQDGGSTWTETYVDKGGALTAAGSAGTDALLIGDGQVLRSQDGMTWTPTRAKTFDGYDVRDVVTLADGRWLATGDYFDVTGGAMSTWIGTAEPLP